MFSSSGDRCRWIERVKRSEGSSPGGQTKDRPVQNYIVVEPQTDWNDRWSDCKNDGLQAQCEFWC